MPPVHTPPRRAARLVPPALVAVLVAYLLAWPVPIDPERWRPPEAPALEGPYAVNDYLAQTVKLGVGVGRNPEDVAFDAEGRMYAGYDDGRIVRWDTEGRHTVFANTAGRPLGLRFAADGTLYVADAVHGLLSVSPEGAVTVLVNTHGGLPFRFTDDLDIAEDGTIYFTDASWKFGPEQFMEDLVEHRPNGRLLAYDPRTGETRQVLGDLYFANGVAVAHDQSHVLVVETGKYHVRRYWLTGERAGTTDLFIENLPGFPDGILPGSDGLYWLAIAYPRNPLLDGMMPVPFLRKMLLRLPAWMRPKPVRHSMVLGLDAEGGVVHNLQDPGAAYAPITNAVEWDGHLHFGSIDEDAVGRAPLPARQP